MVQAKLILLDPKSRKIGLSMRTLEGGASEDASAAPAKKWVRRPETPAAPVATEQAAE